MSARPTEHLLRRLRELRLMLQLSSASGEETRQAFGVLLDDALQQFDAEAEADARRDDAEWDRNSEAWEGR